MPAPLLLALATLLWAGNFVVGERVVGDVGPLSLAWWRWVLAALPLVVLAAVVERPDWPTVLRRWPVLLVMALLGAASYPLLVYLAVSDTTAGNAAIINSTNPVLILLGAALLGQARVTRRSALGVALGLVGVLLVLTQAEWERLVGLRFNTGDLWMLLAVLAWTGYTLLGRRLSVPPLTSVAVQVVLTVLVLTPPTLVDGLSVPEARSTWIAIGYLVLGPSIGSYVCWNLGVSRVPAGLAGASMNLITVFTLLISAVLGVLPTGVQLLGATLIIGGVLLTLNGPAPPTREG